MKKNKTIENNKIIAEFIEWEESSSGGFICPEKYCKLDYESYYKGISSNLEFHSSWDWLMPVVEKIQYINNNQEEFFGDEYYLIHFEIDLLNGVDLIIDKTRVFMQTAFDKGQLIEAVYKGVLVFINWFNKNKV